MPEVQRRAAIATERLPRKPLAVSCKRSGCAYFAREKSKLRSWKGSVVKGQDFVVFTCITQSSCWGEKMLTCKGSTRLDPLLLVKKCCQQTD